LVQDADKLEMTAAIRQILRDHGRLPVDPDDLADDADLYQAGLTSHASVNVMLAVEDTFDTEFPDEMLTRASFESIGAIASAVGRLTGDAAA
jgi:acyl carrier protein